MQGANNESTAITQAVIFQWGFSDPMLLRKAAGILGPVKRQLVAEQQHYALALCPFIALSGFWNKGMAALPLVREPHE